MKDNQKQTKLYLIGRIGSIAGRLLCYFQYKQDDELIESTRVEIKQLLEEIERYYYDDEDTP